MLWEPNRGVGGGHHMFGFRGFAAKLQLALGGFYVFTYLGSIKKRGVSSDLCLRPILVSRVSLIATALSTHFEVSEKRVHT